MTRFFPFRDSIAGRTILILLVGLSLSHLLSIGAYHYDSASMADRSFDRRLADQIVDVRRVLSGVDRTERDRVARLLSARGFEVAWIPTPIGDRDAVVAAEADGDLERRLKTRIGELGEAADGVVAAPDAADPATAARPKARVSVRLADGSFARIEAVVDDADTDSSGRLLLSTGLMAFAVLLLSFLLVRASLSPLRALGRAAERFGVDVDAPPLAEDGPSEIRSAARAFNEMQRRIARLVDDRTQMLAAVSHDLRTPLTVIRLRTELIDDDDLRSRIAGDIDAMRLMIDSTLSFLRDDRTSEDMRVIDIVATLRSVCNDFSDTGASVVYVGDERAVVRGRPIALKRAVTNLVENAVKYAGSARVAARVDGDRVELVIEDDGPGIPEDEMERVFRPFYRLDPSRGGEANGFGLGMAAARAIVLAHGGDIRLSNRTEGGLTVEILLPSIVSTQALSEGVAMRSTTGDPAP